MKKRIVFILVAIFIISSVLPISAAVLDSVRHYWGCDFDNAYYQQHHNAGSSEFMYGSAAAGNILAENWEPIYVDRGTPYILIANQYSNGGFLRMTGQSSYVCLDQWKGDWEFSMLANCDQSNQRFAGMVIRADRDENGRPIRNVYDQPPGYDSSVGYVVGDSGIGITFSNYGRDFVTLYVITKDGDTYSHISSQVYYEVDGLYGAFSNAAWGKIKVVDSNGKLSLYVNDELSMYVTYDNLQNGHYTNATIYDANGTKQASTDKALITEKANIALGSSNAGGFNIDSFSFKDPNSDATPAPTATLAPGQTPVPTQAPQLQRKVINMFDKSFDRTGVVPLHGPEVELGFKFTCESGNSFNQIILRSVATNGAYQTEFTVSVYEYIDDDYDTSILEEPLFSKTIVDHPDNGNCVIDFPDPFGCGHYLIVISDAKTGVDLDGNPLSTGFPLLWKAEPSSDDSIICFENGLEVDYGFYADCVTMIGGDPDGVIGEETPVPATQAPVTSAPVTVAPTEAPATQAPNEDKSCGSSSAVAQVMLILSAALIIKRKAK